ncbi:hypothetical protein D3C77_588510 [compost metagenome]
MLGHCHDTDQGQDHGAKAANPATQELHLWLIPTEVQLGHAARGKYSVRGVEHQPGLGNLPQRRAKVGVLTSSVDLQGKAAQRQAKAHR